MTQLHSPYALVLLLVLPLLIWLTLRTKRAACMKFSSLGLFKNCKTPWRVKFRWLPFFLRILCLVLLIIALARPRHGIEKSVISTEGVAMQLVVDCSGSMAEEIEFAGKKISKLKAVKNVVKDFVLGDGDQLKGRTGDLIGLITYATYPETLCPLVHSHQLLIDFLQRAQPIRHRQLGNTAIGDAVALAAARLHQAEKEIMRQNKFQKSQNDRERQKQDSFEIKSKIMILLTDGKQNAGDYTPAQAAQLAKDWDIKIYAIGLAGDLYRQTIFGQQKIPPQAQIDERLLKSVSSATGGKYFRASDAQTLKQIYENIDRLEKTDIESIRYTDFAERFSPFAKAAMIILIIEILTRTLIFRKLP